MKVILEAGDRAHLTHMMVGWVKGMESAAADLPQFGIAGLSRLLSPRDLLQAVQEETEVGERYIHDLAEVVALAAFKDVAKRTFV